MMLNWGHYHRRIPLDKRSRPGAGAKLWMGIPRGRWEGDTLVIESTNFNGKMWLDSVGNFVSENVRVIERLRLVEANTMDYEVTIDDPSVLRRRGPSVIGCGAPARAAVAAERRPTIPMRVSRGSTRATRGTAITSSEPGSWASSGTQA